MRRSRRNYHVGLFTDNKLYEADGNDIETAATRVAIKVHKTGERVDRATARWGVRCERVELPAAKYLEPTYICETYILV